MDKIYISDNYIIIEQGGKIIPFTKKSLYSESLDSFNLWNKDIDFTIGFSEVGNYYNEAGDTAYTESTLRLFFRINTSIYSSQNITEVNFRKLTAYNGIISAKANILTINADTTKFDVKSFKYRFIDRTDPENPIETIQTFDGLTEIVGTLLTSLQTTYIYIDINGTISQSLIIQGGIEIYNKILIGNLDPDNGGTFFSSVANSPQVGYDIEQTIESLLRRLGGTNLEGCILSGNSDLTLQKTVGTALGLGRGYNTDFNIPNVQLTLEDSAVGTAPGFIALGYVDNLGNIVTSLISSREIDPTKYNNEGILTAATSSQFTILRLFYFYGSEVLYIYYGNAVYNSLANAKLGIGTELFIENPITYEATSRGFLIVKSDAIDLSIGATAEFILPNRIRL